MIRYSYNRQLVPPAPFIHVTLRCVESGRELGQVPAQIDTAADRTVLPGRCVQELSLLPLDELPIGGFGGQVLLLPTYRVQVSIHELAPVMIEAIAHADETYVLLGRDVLNQYQLLLNGPQLFLELGP
jgi:hypothetical protein